MDTRGLIKEQFITSEYAIYNGDCIVVMNTLPSESIHFSLYSPPFAGLYQYSSDDADMSNSISYKEFLKHYAFAIDDIFRLTLPGRISAVHCMDVPKSNSGCDIMRDFPGDVIRLHKKRGFDYAGRYHIWKEPLTVRNRTMMKSLHHKTLCLDSTKVSIANADYLLIFRKKGNNPFPVAHPQGMTYYAGARQIPSDILKYRGMEGDQKKNRFSQWIWRQYASCFWDDIRIDEILPHKEGRDPEDEKHVHPLQLDVITRAIMLYTNPDEIVLTPFMGIGSEVFGAVINKRKGIGIELKLSYFRQSCRNLSKAMIEKEAQKQIELFK